MIINAIRLWKPPIRLQRFLLPIAIQLRLVVNHGQPPFVPIPLSQNGGAKGQVRRECDVGKMAALH
jgi:hypothetical protein